MKNVIKVGICIFLCVLSSCRPPRIDEKYAATVVKDKLSLSGKVSAKKLTGGASGTSLFLASEVFLTDDNMKKYVVKFVGGGYRHKSEIYNLKVASDGEYGPHLYFSDPAHGIMIMEYLPDKKITYHELQTRQFYVALAHLLQKIHQGQAFSGRPYNIFNRISDEIQTAKTKFGNDVPLTKFEHMLRVVRQILLPHLTTNTPCHNDLHVGNLRFLGNEFKAIDYGDASQGDPYIDIATIARVVNPLCMPAHENVLFSTYLGRQPSMVEKAKLYLMTQAVSMRWFTTELERLSPKIVRQFGLIKTPSIREIEREILEDKINLSKPDNKLKRIKAWFNQIFENFESQEFKTAIKVLQNTSARVITDKELMEYISGKTTSTKYLQSDKFYRALAHLLQNIHRGQAIEGRGDYVFRRIDRMLQNNKSKYGSYVPLTRVEHVVNVIHQALLPHLITNVPCHNDLHRGNLIFWGNKFTAFGYGDASQGDPYFDIATVVASFYCNPAHEKILFATYLGRQPSGIEQAKLYLMKRAVWLKWFLDDLGGLSPEIVSQYGVIKTFPIINLAGKFLKGSLDLSKPEDRLKLLKSQLNQIFEHFESQKFRDAVNVLSGAKQPNE